VQAEAKYHLGQVVCHKKHPFRGVIFDVDSAIPEEARPVKDQPFYHLLAENDQSYYIAYVSEQNLMADISGDPVDHPDVEDIFGPFENGAYPLQFQMN
jgi:heat shock protein HspQ